MLRVPCFFQSYSTSECSREHKCMDVVQSEFSTIMCRKRATNSWRSIIAAGITFKTICCTKIKDVAKAKWWLNNEKGHECCQSQMAQQVQHVKSKYSMAQPNARCYQSQTVKDATKVTWSTCAGNCSSHKTRLWNEHVLFSIAIMDWNNRLVIKSINVPEGCQSQLFRYIYIYIYIEWNGQGRCQSQNCEFGISKIKSWGMLRETYIIFSVDVEAFLITILVNLIFNICVWNTQPLFIHHVSHLCFRRKAPRPAHPALDDTRLPAVDADLGLRGCEAIWRDPWCDRPQSDSNSFWWRTSRCALHCKHLCRQGLNMSA